MNGANRGNTAPSVAHSASHLARATAAGPPGPADDVSASRPPGLEYRQVALVDLLDRLLAGGVVISGEIRLSIADVDLVAISLRAFIASLSSALEYAAGEGTADDQ